MRRRHLVMVLPEGDHRIDSGSPAIRERLLRALDAVDRLRPVELLARLAQDRHVRRRHRHGHPDRARR